MEGSGRLAGKVCLVTGGGSGRPTALRMALDGASAVLIAGRRREQGEAATAAVSTVGAEGPFIQTDVTPE